MREILRKFDSRDAEDERNDQRYRRDVNYALGAAKRACRLFDPQRDGRLSKRIRAVRKANERRLHEDQEERDDRQTQRGGQAQLARFLFANEKARERGDAKDERVR